MRRTLVASATALCMGLLAFPLVSSSSAFRTMLGAAVRAIDGDTIELNGETVRIANIDTPETDRAKCPEERAMGEAATVALTELLGRGAITLQRGDPKSGRKIDRYGRTLGLVFVDGHDVGELLITMGHARRWTGKRRPWCSGVQ